MAIQMRRGNEADLDITQLKPGEIAVCLDAGKIIVKLGGGNYLTLTDTDAIQEIVNGKAAASHTHAQSDITGLSDALSGKADGNHNHSGVYAPASHTHTKSQITDLANATPSTNGVGGSAGLMSGADKEKLDGINIVVLSQSEYEALDPPVSGVLYLITEDAEEEGE